MYDAVIIGTGPAGLSAAINLKLHEKSFVWFGSKSLSEKVKKAEKVFNYPGFVNVTGKELCESFIRHAEMMQLEVTEKMVNTIIQTSGYYMLNASNDIYEAKTLILTMGIMNTSGLTGEADFVGKGVSYCATCDGVLYRGKKIAVICSSAQYEHEVEYLAGLAEQVYFFPGYPDNGISAPNVEWVKKAPVSVCGEKHVIGIAMRDGSVLPVDGIFCLRDSIAPTTLLSGLAVNNGHIVVDRNMATNLPGCFAAGDCTGRPYQYAKAVGEGNVAAHSVIEYLSKEGK